MRIIGVTEDTLNSLYNRFGSIAANHMYHGLEGKELFYKAFGKSCLLIDIECGIARISSYQYGHTARIHALFDNNPYRKIKELREGISSLIELLHVLRLEVTIPTGTRGISHLLNALSFSFEGTLRNYLYNGTMCKDADMYSIVKEGYDVTG